jgi:hypothetical protein
MDPWQDLKTWSKQHREEALQEAREHHLADQHVPGSPGLPCSR